MAFVCLLKGPDIKLQTRVLASEKHKNTIPEKISQSFNEKHKQKLKIVGQRLICPWLDWHAILHQMNSTMARGTLEYKPIKT